MPHILHNDNEFSPVEICEWFDIPRTTLFRWEETGVISRAERGPRGRRIYRRTHLKEIQKVVRGKIHEEVELSSRQDGLYPTPDLLERLHKAEYFGSDDPEHGLRQLQGLAKTKGLSSHTIRTLVDDALNRPRNDAIRQQVWKLLMVNDQSDTANAN